jgi:hypothetical protein
MKGRTAGRPYVCLDLGFHSDPKILAVGNGAAGLFCRALSYCGNHRTDGFVPKTWAQANGTRTERQRLVDAGLWLIDESGYHVVNWTRYQQTRAEVEAMQRERSEAGKKGAEARWDGKRHNSSYGKSHNNSDGKEKKTLKKTLTSSLPTEASYEEAGQLPTAEELRKLAKQNGLEVPKWALQEDGQAEDIAF